MSTKKKPTPGHQPRHGDGKFAAQAKPESSVQINDATPGDWHVGPGFSDASAKVSAIMRDWEDHLSCAEAVNESYDVLYTSGIDPRRASYLALSEGTTDDYDAYYRIAVFDSEGTFLANANAPGSTFNEGWVPEQFRGNDSTAEAIGADYCDGVGTQMVVDVSKVAAYDWDTNQAAVLLRASRAALGEGTDLDTANLGATGNVTV